MLKKVPHTYVIIFSLIVVAAIATWFVPGGEYVPVDEPSGDGEVHEVVFKRVENRPQTWQVFSAMFEGFEKQAGIIVFILMIGGAFWIMNDSKAIDIGILSFLKFIKRLNKYKLIKAIGANNLIIVMVMVIFSIFGAVFGMSEETIAFIVILVPLSISMGYDSIMGISMVFVAAGLGFAGAVLNPFTVGIAQGLAGLPLFSGFEYRLFSWGIINIAGISYVLWYGARIKKNPKQSPVYEEDHYWRHEMTENSLNTKHVTYTASWITYFLTLTALVLFSIYWPVTTLKIGSGEGVTGWFVPGLTALFAIAGFLALRKSSPAFVLVILGFTILFLIVGVMGFGWYIMEIATLFFAMGIISGAAMNKSADEITHLFLSGAKDIISAALVVGLAGGIIVILENGHIIHTILHAMANGMKDSGDMTSVTIMYAIQTMINIVIPSGSAQAALTIPIMAPFSDLIGISRQTTVMVFQFGDGFTNLITPTSGVLIGVLGVARIPYIKWARWVAPLIAILIILGMLLLIPTVTINLNGF